MLEVMKVLEQVGGSGGSEFFATHPNPPRRMHDIELAIQRTFPNGVPDNLEK